MQSPIIVRRHQFVEMQDGHSFVLKSLAIKTSRSSEYAWRLLPASDRAEVISFVIFD